MAYGSAFAKFETRSVGLRRNALRTARDNLWGRRYRRSPLRVRLALGVCRDAAVGASSGYAALTERAAASGGAANRSG